MLTSLQGNTHQVYTGVCTITIFRDGKEPKDATVVNFSEKTNVTVFEMTDDEIKEYVQSGEPMDKAGAYGIQGVFAKYIEKIEGDYNNVVGLPIGRVWQVCMKHRGQ